MTVLTVTATVTDMAGLSASAVVSATIGVAQPDLSNTGPDTGLTVSTGDRTYSTNNQVVENLEIHGRVSFTGKGQKMRNCRVLGGTPATSGGLGLIQCTNVNVQDLYLENVECVPINPSFTWNGIVGHDFVGRGLKIHHCQDGIQIKNSSAPYPFSTGVDLQQSYIYDMAWWTASTGGIVHPTDTETHNDGIQHMQGLDSIIKWNTIDSRFAKQYGHWVVTNPNVEPYVTVPLHSLPDGGPYQNIPDRGTGSAATGRYNWDDQSCLMIGDEEGKPTYRLVFEDNWLYGGNFSVNGGGNSNPGGGVILGSIKRNKFDRTQGNQGSGGNTTQTINFQLGGWSASTVDIPLTGPDANVYMDDGSPVTVRF